MSPRCPRPPPPLLVLVLCWLVARPALGLPVRPSSAPPRDLEESASGDDLISGSDFLSVFIGASIPPRQGRARGLSGARSKVAEEPEQSLGAFGARLIPKPKSSTQPPPPPTPPPPPPPPPRVAADAPSETKGRFLDLSNSKAPSIETVSFDPSNIEINPLPEASARIAHRTEPNSDFQTESIAKSNREDETTRLDTFEYYSQSPTEDTSTNSDSIATTSNDDLLDLVVSDVEPQKQSAKTDVTIITEVVTSREEVVPSTEPTSVVYSQESHEHEAQASIKHHHAVSTGKFREHPVKSSADDHQNSVAVTSSSAEETATFPPSTDAGGPPPPPPPVQVVSVRVSSSVVQGPSPAPHVTRTKTKSEDATVTKHDGLSQTPAAPASEEEMQRQFESESANALILDTTLAPVEQQPELDSPQAPAPALITEEQPTNIAVQRSEFSVEEASPSSSELSPRRDDPSGFHKTVARVVEVSRNSQSAPVSYHTSVSSATSGSRVQFYSEPPSYHREMPSNVAESIRTSVVTSNHHVRAGSSRPKYEHVNGGPMGGSSKEAIESRMGRYGTPHHEVRISGPHEHVSFTSQVRSSQERPQELPSAAAAREHKSFRHSEIPERNYAQPERNYAKPERNYAQTERNYAQPERNYGQTERNYAHPERTYSLPEQNYEVDEAVSVMSNGRAHGVQPTTPASPAPPPPQQPAAPEVPVPTHAGPAVERALGVLDTSQGRDPNHKFGYVVEGRNFRKYRVEERTPDGFIVGEYGVVSHDDGSLRGVRYTADGTINPQLIHEALVKFLSL